MRTPLGALLSSLLGGLLSGFTGRHRRHRSFLGRRRLLTLAATARPAARSLRIRGAGVHAFALVVFGLRGDPLSPRISVAGYR